VAVVGDPSSGKTQGLKAVLDVLREIDRDLQAERKRRRAVHKVQVDRAAVIKAAWREEAKKAVKEGLAMPDCPPEAEPPPFQDVARVLISDATIEKVARIVATSPKGVLSIGAEAGPRLGAQSGPLCLRRTISPSELVGVAQTG
jgi:hypothetical protein